MKIICFGDSNTWGYDPRGPFGGRYDQNWPELLAKKTGWNVINQGENGREIPKGSASFPLDTSLLIIMLGTNDLLQFRPPEEVCDKMEHFLISLNLERRKILLIAPPPMMFGAWVEDQELINRSLSLIKGYQGLAERLGIRYADAGEWNVSLAFDGVHFTQEGHRAFANGLLQKLSGLSFLEDKL